jgi:hypothetical protein
MAILGVVAEFNPFHNGTCIYWKKPGVMKILQLRLCNERQLSPARRTCAVQQMVACPYGSSCRRDLVIEIPFCFAVRSAYFFARGAMELLYRTGVVTHVAFGSESGNIDELRSIASIIAHESDEYQSILRYHLDQGISFPRQIPGCSSCKRHRRFPSGKYSYATQ